MFRIILLKPQREEDKLIAHEEARRKQTHPDITTMIGPVLTHIPMKFYYREYMLKKKNFVFWYSIIKLWPNLVKVLILDKTIFCCNLWRLLCVCRPSQGIMSIIINRHQATIAQLLTKSTPCPYTNDFRWEMIIPPNQRTCFIHVSCVEIFWMSGDSGHGLNFLSW